MSTLRRIRDLADQVRGVTYTKNDASLTPVPGSVAVLRAGNIQDSDLVLDDLVYVPRARISEDQILRKHDVLIATSSGSLDVVGKAAQATSDVGMGFGAFCKVLRPRKQIHPRYFAYYFRTPQYRRTISLLAAGANINNLRNEHLEDLVVPVPSVDEQRRIADLLDRADAIRRKCKRAVDLTEELLRSAFFEMFGDPVINPKHWDKVPLRTLSQITTGNTPSRAVPENFGSDIEWIKSDNINTSNHFLTPSAEGLSARGRALGRTAPAGSTLMTCIAGSPDCIGNVALADREVAFNQQINAITPLGDADYRYLYVMLLVGKRIVQAASTNSMKGMVSKGKLEEIRVPFPPLSLQMEFGEIFQRIHHISGRQGRELNNCERLFDSLLGSAFASDRVRA